ncbi:MAG: carbamoyltransferase C-terminal domain-containing protein [Polyangiales bacterium]
MLPIDSGGSALIADGVVVGALAEERVTRRKHDGGYRRSLDALLEHAGLAPDDVDFYYLSFYGSPLTPPAAIVEHHLRDLGLERSPERLVIVPSHHLSHAASSFFLSPFDEALVMVSDSEGSELAARPAAEAATGWCERNSYYIARHNQLHLLERDFEGPGAIGFGKAFTRFTRYVGLGDYHAAGKTMGLASYGQLSPALGDLDLFTQDASGRLTSALGTTPETGGGIRRFFADRGVSIPPLGAAGAYEAQPYRDLAAFVQHQLCKWAERRLSPLLERTGLRKLCLGGGVALNSILNSHLEEVLGVEVFVPPYPSDEGQALGNALLGYIEQAGLARNPLQPAARFTDFAFLGPDYKAARVEAVAVSARGHWTVERPADLSDAVAALLASGRFVGWFQGRSEYGARALGNRSILADPRDPETSRRLNRTKGREPFRPFAPSVLAPHAKEYFDRSGSPLLAHMLGVSRARADRAAEIPAVVHVDGTARVQVVSREDNPRFYDVIAAFHARTGIPMVLNTSFNAAGEPIVESPEDALRSAEAMRLHALVLGDFVLRHAQVE